MKIIDIPKSGKCGDIVAYESRWGQCQRQLVVPTNRQTAAREARRGAFGRLSRAWGTVLTEAQRQAWNAAGPEVESGKRLGQSGPLTGQMHFVGINSARACIGREMLMEPPEPVVFGANPVEELTMRWEAGRVKMELRVPAAVREDIMVFGQGPCSAGRSKRRNVSYLGVLPKPVDGVSDITELYVGRFGEPRAGEKVFIVVRQQANGWEGEAWEVSEVVPERVFEGQAAGEAGLTLHVHMHKGCTREVQGINEAPAGGGEKGAGALESSEIRRPESEAGGIGADGCPRPEASRARPQE
jgi:hypothetical protein